jgi:ubiquitin-protein ligase
MDALQNSIVTALNPASYTNKQKQDLHQELTQVLHRYPSLTIRCYSHKSNTSTVNLAQLEGILSLFYKKVKYNIPILLIYPQNYPQDPPSLYVTPSSTMVLNLNNKKVDQSGKITLKVLTKWKKKPATCLILDEAKELFENDIPLFSTTGVVQIQSYPQSVTSSSGVVNSAFAAASGFFKSVEQAFTGNPRQAGSQVAPSNNQVSGYPQTVPSSSSGVLVTSGVSGTSSTSGSSGSSGSSSTSGSSGSSNSSSSSGPSSQSSGLSSLFGASVGAGLSSKASTGHSKPLPEISSIKFAYVARVKSLKEEISVLLKERETLKSNSILINKDLEEYSGRVEKTQALRTLLQSSLSNTEDWLLQAKSQKSSEVL